MADCCTPKGYRWVFSEREAEKEARRYRSKGLDATSRRIVDFLKKQGIDGCTVLEVGGGIGAIQLELLKAGASRAVSVELTPTYEQVAARLVEEAGMSERVERKVTDFVMAGDAIAAADVVIMNRVLCCYWDMPRLAGAAADHARQVLVMSYPKRTWWTVIGLGIANLILQATRRGFHLFLHSPREILATSARHGLETVLEQRTFLWTVAGFSRAA